MFNEQPSWLSGEGSGEFPPAHYGSILVETPTNH